MPQNRGFYDPPVDLHPQEPQDDATALKTRWRFSQRKLSPAEHTRALLLQYGYYPEKTDDSE